LLHKFALRDNVTQVKIEEHVMMKQILILVSVGLLVLNAAHAANLSISINNKSGQVLTSVVATPQNGGAATNVISAPLAAAKQVSANLVLPTGVCVFTLVYSLANGKVVTLPDTDLCQTDQIIVE
jgi:hypothetical protein